MARQQYGTSPSNARDAASKAYVDSMGLARIEKKILWDVDADWNSFGDVLVSNDVAPAAAGTFVRTTVAETGGNGATGNGRMGKVAGPTSGTSGTNVRRWYPYTPITCADQECESVFYGSKDASYSLGQRPGPGYGQQGLILRYNPTGGPTFPANPWAVVVWHDAVFGVPYIINTAIWQIDTTKANPNVPDYNDVTGPGSGPDVNSLKSNRNTKFELTGGALTSNVVTAEAPLHGVRLKDRIQTTFPLATGMSQSTITEVTAVTNEAIFTYPKTNANVTRIATPGWGVNYSRIFPFHLKARMIGQRLWVKAWPDGINGEPAWGDPDFGFYRDFTTAPASGQMGLFCGHIDPAVSRWVGFGETTFRSLDAT